MWRKMLSYPILSERSMTIYVYIQNIQLKYPIIKKITVNTKIPDWFDFINAIHNTQQS